MSAPVIIEPSVELLIEGIIALFLERDENGQVVACLAGVVPDVPEHVFEVVGTKIDQNGQITPVNFNPIAPELLLEAQGTTQTGIRFAGMDADINRLTGGGAPESFKWVLDFEGAELHNREIGVNRAKFISVLRITSGVLFTSVISRNFLLARDSARPNDPLTLIGKVATKVGVAIDLDAPGSTARLSNGANESVSVAQGERLIVEVKNTCPTEDPLRAGLRAAHANHYYNAIGDRLAPGETKNFSSTRFDAPGTQPPVSPEASCLVSGSGTSGGGN
jgi:hypothetical protein